jgi:hypothetical protein
VFCFKFRRVVGNDYTVRFGTLIIGAPVPRNQLIDVDDDQPGLLIAGELLRESDRAIPGIRSVSPGEDDGKRVSNPPCSGFWSRSTDAWRLRQDSTAMGSSRHLTGSRRSRA